LEQALEGTHRQRIPSALALNHRIGIDPKKQTPDDFELPKGKRLSSPDGSVVWNATVKEKSHMVLHTPATRGVWGLVANQTFKLGGLTLSVGKTERNYAAIILTSLDGQPLESSKRMLLTATGSAENLDMEWNFERTSVSNKWGRGPTQINLIHAKITLEGNVNEVHALDGVGKRLGQIEVTKGDGRASFSIGKPEAPTLWYEVVAE